MKNDDVLPRRKRGAPFGNRNAAGEERTGRRWGMRFTAAEMAAIDAAIEHLKLPRPCALREYVLAVTRRAKGE